MPAVSPFRALRYDEDEAGPLADLIAPPYDVIDDELRLEYLRRSPYNVVHLTLPDSPEAAGATLAGWRERGVLREDEPALWWLAQDYVGPDGVARSARASAARSRRPPTRPARCCRTSARTRARRRDASGCCRRPAPSSSRSS